MSIHSTKLGDDEIARPSCRPKIGGPPSVTVKYASIADWCVISGMGRTSTYEAIGRGDLRAIKLAFKTLVDVEHGLTWLATMPPAKITTGRRNIRDTTVT